MKNIQPNENNFQKNKYIKTELPITIVTDEEYKQGDNLELTRQRIEKATLYIHSLFNSIRYSLENLPSFDDQKLEEVVWDARNVCEIGYGVADSILASASTLTEFIPDETESKRVNQENEDTEKYTGDLEIDQVALAISGLLNNPNVPKPLARGFLVAMTDFINSQLGHDEFNEDTSSGEYIARHLKVYKNENES